LFIVQLYYLACTKCNNDSALHCEMLPEFIAECGKLKFLMHQAAYYVL